LLGLTSFGLVFALLLTFLWTAGQISMTSVLLALGLQPLNLLAYLFSRQSHLNAVSRVTTITLFITVVIANYQLGLTQTFLVGYALVVLTASALQGIASKDLPYLFDRFYRGHGDSSLSVPGTGLGLALVREIIDLHGGEITVESQESIGSTFRVWLPVADT
jgi:hypothetical protein